ncbi:MAG: hypothetical protein LUG25_00095, partial [Oscillospiraceae bacterium]|nr:hypothetical protein [Oscillospiraceae bacterium]
MKIFSDLQKNRSRIGSLFPFSRRGSGFITAATTCFRNAAKVNKGRALFGKGKRKQAKVQYSCGF